MEKTARHPSSYRDPSGFVFIRDGILYRQVNKVFATDFDHFINSGCYERLLQKNLLVPHEQFNSNLNNDAEWYTTLKPAQVAFITYPYEWSFHMLKDAALLTLQITSEAIATGMILKDASPYNIQWQAGKPVFIDTLSFERYNETEPWIAYRQFCEHFLGPLLVMHYRKKPLQQLQLSWPEGIPLDIVRSFLPWRSRFSMHTYLHIHLNARLSAKADPGKVSAVKFSKQKMLNLLSSLETLTSKLDLPVQESTWSAYYDEAAGRGNYLETKKSIIEKWLGTLSSVKTVADLGANDGVFTRLAAEKGFNTVATDFDPYCIDNLYQEVKKKSITNILPMITDLSNPSPATGVNNEERSSFTSRINTDAAMALALIHHLAIGKNIPFESIAELFARLVKCCLIIEFVPKSDEKVQLMLRNKKDIYTAYTEENFREQFEKYFKITETQPVGISGRVLYLMTKHES